MAEKTTEINTEKELLEIKQQLAEIQAELMTSKATVAKQAEAINKLVNAMASRYAQDLLKEVLPE